MMIVNTVDPNDISQGAIGNCYLMSSISSLAEEPQRIIRLFENQTINKEGVYFVKMNIDGVVRYIILDDYFPCDDNHEPIFA